ncbi:MAG TPA: NAD(P)-dependent oxidoreductase [Thermoleophilia bacterium]|nr:NAD(P)-dependent oxidoreductase [Thermoleophilia bacterium]
MKALVIGGSGLFGKKTCSALLNDPDFNGVVAFDLVPPPDYWLKSVESFGDKYKFVRGDISDLEQLMAAASANGCDRIVNWAMILSKEPMPRANTKVGLLGMCNVFETARLLGIKRVVYASSETVYGEQSDYGDREVHEDDRLLPYTGSFYALAKCLAEVVAGQYHELYGIEPTALRPCIGYGHGGKDPKFVRWFSEIVSLPAVGKPVHLECTGEALFSTVLSDQVADFARLALKTASSPHTAYNLGGAPTTLKEMATAVKKLIPEARITFGNEPEGCELPWKVNCDRARQDYGFNILSRDEAILLHANEARADAGLPSLKP